MMDSESKIKMTGKERVRNAIAHIESDVVPFDPYVSPGHAVRLSGHMVHEMYTTPGLLIEAMVNATRRYSADICYCRPDAYLGYNRGLHLDNEDLLLVGKTEKIPSYRLVRDSISVIPLNPPGESQSQGATLHRYLFPLSPFMARRNRPSQLSG